MSAYRDIRAAWVCQGLSQSWSGGVFSVIINTTGHTQLLRAFQKYSHVFNTSFFGRKMINDKCAHTHTPVAEHSVASHSFNSPVLVPLIFGGSVLSCRKKKSHIWNQSTKETKLRLSQWFNGGTEVPWEWQSGNTTRLQSWHGESDCPVN